MISSQNNVQKYFTKGHEQVLWKLEKKSQNENALKKIFKPIMGGARWMIFFRLLRCDVVTTNLLRDVSKLTRLERGTEMRKKLDFTSCRKNRFRITWENCYSDFKLLHLCLVHLWVQIDFGSFESSWLSTNCFGPAIIVF